METVTFYLQLSSQQTPLIIIQVLTILLLLIHALLIIAGLSGWECGYRKNSIIGKILGYCLEVTMYFIGISAIVELFEGPGFWLLITNIVTLAFSGVAVTWVVDSRPILRETNGLL